MTNTHDEQLEENNSEIPDSIEEALKYDRDDSSAKQIDFRLMAVTEFSEITLDDKLRSVLTKIGWHKPTEVQGLCLPHTLKGKDVAGFAQTGTGKTGVFLITAAEHLIRSKSKSNDPACIILAPTRELAIQIDEECKNILGPLGLKSIAVYGGIDYEKQANAIRQGVDVIVATPGRLRDYTNKKIVNWNSVSLFICDEVDRMFEMGFIEDVEYFLESINEASQKLFFSATTNENVKELSFEYLNKPQYITVSPDTITSENIEQSAILCETQQKLKVFIGLLRDHEPERAIIFANTKLTAAWLNYKLKGNNFDVECITGDLPQRKRIGLVKRIKNGKIKLLIATDVASRGLHIANVSHVYNFDLPGDPANYVHRIGRTARAGAKGVAFSLVCEEYAQNLLGISELLGSESPKCAWFPVNFLDIKDESGDPFEDNFGRSKSSQKTGQNKKQRKPKGKSSKTSSDRKPSNKDKKPKNKSYSHKDDKNKSLDNHKNQKQRLRQTQTTNSKDVSFKTLVKKMWGALFGSK